MSLRKFVPYLLVLSLLTLAQSAWAQSTAVLLDITNPSSETSDVWWASDPPNYSANMRKLFSGLEEGGVAVLKPQSVTDISSVIRQPKLSKTNALNLARLLGAERALLGSVQIESLGEVTALPILGYRVSYSGAIVDLKTGEETPIDVSSSHWERSSEAATQTAFSNLGQALASRISKPKKSALSGPTGFDSGAFQVRIRTSSGKWFDETVNWLLSTGKVSEIEFAWVSTGLIALHLISESNKRLQGPEINALARELVNQAFEGFNITLSTSEEPQAVEITLSEKDDGMGTK